MNLTKASSRSAFIAATLASILTLLLLDGIWLGLIAKKLYADLLPTLMRSDVVWPAAVLFYVMYISATVMHAVIPALHKRSALLRGAALGFVSYATYDLTNWATLRDWPAILVPIDIAWGVILTGITALVGKATFDFVRRSTANRVAADTF